VGEIAGKREVWTAHRTRGGKAAEIDHNKGTYHEAKCRKMACKETKSGERRGHSLSPKNNGMEISFRRAYSQRRGVESTKKP